METSKKLSLGFKFSCVGVLFTACAKQIPQAYFTEIKRKQYTDITTRSGINAIPNEQSPVWAMGWDKRSIRLKVRENGQWQTFLLPKAAYNNDPSHGWFTEWPRIREIGNGKFMMDMHGMFYDFPGSFSIKNTAGIRPISSHLRYIPDFCSWNNQIVLATDETSVQGNPLSGQPQSNLWFGTLKDIQQWGPTNGYGCIWLNDPIRTGQPSFPYLLGGFDNRMIHILNHSDSPLTLKLQIDKKGDGQWSDYQTLCIDGNGNLSSIFPRDIKGEWLRVIPMNNGVATFALHYTTNQLNTSKPSNTLFSSLADIDYNGNILGAKFFSNRNNFNLSCFTSVIQQGDTIEKHPFEFQKFTFDFQSGITDTIASRSVETQAHHLQWSVDEASVILHTSKGNLRLPKGNPAFNKHISHFRAIRELESERVVTNIHGTFYEVPLMYVGKEALFDKMRPISSHNKWIDDYATWNGLLILSGIMKDAKSSKHVYKNKENTAGLWIGGIDDLWKMGKPVGTGGPWKNTAVKKGIKSDPYLMTGYDKKTLILSADKDVNVTLYLSVAHYLKKRPHLPNIHTQSRSPPEISVP